MKIAVAGTGYVGLSMAVLLSQKNEVVAIDVVKEKVQMINNKISPIKDKEIQAYLGCGDLHLKATTNHYEAYHNAEYIIVAVPTNYDECSNQFDTSAVESVIEEVLKSNDNGTIIIKSTIPVGYTKRLCEYYNTKRIIFSPEFLREGKALYDNLYPSRIVIGSNCESARKFSKLLIEGAKKENIEVLFTDSTEAEAIKLFANTYLAMRVAFFNELDTYCEIKGLNTKQIINGISLDSRIGNHYNNPSFGYGGYCLPKDTKQMRANFEGVPNNIIKAIVDANETRKQHIANMILSKKPKRIGVYRLIMKQGSDNFRKSAIFEVISILSKNNIEILIYEPTLKTNLYNGYHVAENLDNFKNICDLIIVNRMDSNISDVMNKVYTRDIFGRD